MYLVDTSVWVDFLQGRDNEAVEFLSDALQNPLAVGLSEQIYLEILQGAESIKAFDVLQAYFSGQQFYEFDNSLHSHESAARLYCNCRRQGITPRSAMDCLIAQCALEHNLVLLHKDRDYLNMRKILPELKQQHFLAV